MGLETRAVCYNISMLRIVLLGPPAIFDNDKLLDIKRRISRALLFYLACHKDPVGREELISLFWPEGSESEGRNNLRDALSKLRSQLPDPGVLTGDRDRVGLDYQRVSSDVLEFENTAETNRWIVLQTPANIPLPPGVYQQLSEAVHLWRSPNFMAGVSLPQSSGYDIWVSDTSARLEQTRTGLIDRLAEHSAASGDIEMAVHWARSNLEVDPLNEELNFRLMNWLNEAGRRSDAIHQYNLFCKRFKRENLTPSPAIEQLYQKIQSQLLERLPETHVSWPVSLNLQYPLVGQSRAIQDLRLAFRRGQTAVLLGEAGSGKTRLAYELYHTLDPSPRLLYSTARSLETRLPFQPLIDMLRHSVRPEEWSALAPVWSAALARILPELALDSDVRRFQPLEDRPILLEAILNILQIVARSQRVLFVLDDAHWCDEDTLEAVAYLIGRNFFLNHGLLLITARPEEKNPALQTLLDTVQYSYSLTRITLEPLSIEEIAQLSQFVVGRPVPADLVARLARESLGSPLFLLENLRALMDAYPDLSKLAGQESLPVPESIHAILHQRVALLSANATQVLTAAAILAEPFPPALIEEVTSLGPDAVALALEELEDARLLAPVTDPAYGAAYTIQHNSLRNAFVLTLSLARQRIYHLRVARALERRSASPTPVLAQHLEAGGELQRAFDAWLAVGRAAGRSSRVDSGYPAFQKAEKLLQHLGRALPDTALPDSALYRLYTDWAGLAFSAHDLETAVDLAATLLAHGQQRRSQLLIGSAYHLQARQALHTYQPALALERVEKALAALETGDCPCERVRIYITRARAYLYLDRCGDAEASFQEALTAGQACTDPEHLDALADAEYSLGLANALRGFSGQAELLARSSLAKAEQALYPVGILRARMVLMRTSYLQSRYEEALEEHWSIKKQVPSQPTPFTTSMLEATAARCYLALGDVDQALAALRKAAEAGARLGANEHSAELLYIRGWLHDLLLDYPAAIEFHKKGVACGHSFYWRMLNLYPLGLAQLETGEIETGMANVREAIARSRAANMPFLYQMAEVVLATWLLRHGQEEEACAIEQRISAEVEKSSLASCPTRLVHLRALIAVANQNYDRATAILEDQVRMAQQSSTAWFELYGYRLLDRVAALQNRPMIHQDSIRRLLMRLSIKCQDEEIRPAFDRFRNKMQSGEG